VTPRDGCAVEVNALWYFLVEYLERLNLAHGDENAGREWGSLKLKAAKAFIERFWLPEENYLADVWKDGVPDRAVRPNMVIAASLEFSPLSRGMRTDIVQRAHAELLTPFGLRTLEPPNPAYKGRYFGGPEERDRAYHQGTVWPWLIGPYCEAYLRAHGAQEKSRQALRELLDGFEEQLAQFGLNHVSEVLDGDPPYRPGGTIAQAWNAAEILRAYRLLEVPP
jgi:glycogen debranching enzyme